MLSTFDIIKIRDLPFGFQVREVAVFFQQLETRFLFQTK